MLVYQRVIHLYLVGGIPTPLKNDGVKVSWGYSSRWKVIKFHGSKTPTRLSSINHQPFPTELWKITMLSMGKSTDQVIL